MNLCRLLPLALVLLTLGTAAAAAHTLECPAAAPAEWGVAKAPLDGVDVLSLPGNETIDETAPPSLIPDENGVRAGTLRQVWQMNTDDAGWVRFVDCHYRGTKRILRLEANHLTRRARSISHYRNDKTALSIETMACD